MVTQVGSRDFDEILRKSQKPAAVNFTADWCPDCRRFKPVFEAVSEEYADRIDFYSVDTEERGDLADRYDVMSIPTVFVFKNGETAGRDADAGTKARLLDMISPLLSR